MKLALTYNLYTICCNFLRWKDKITKVNLCISFGQNLLKLSMFKLISQTKLSEEFRKILTVLNNMLKKLKRSRQNYHFLWELRCFAANELSREMMWQRAWLCTDLSLYVLLFFKYVCQYSFWMTETHWLPSTICLRHCQILPFLASKLENVPVLVYVDKSRSAK